MLDHVIAAGRRRALAFATLPLARLVCLLVCLLPMGQARAAQLPDHDLRSLALMSDAVVRVRITGQRPGAHGPVHEHEVVEILAGELAVGERVDLAYGSYSFEPHWSETRTLDFDDEALLFLAREDAEDGASWRLLPSGLRRSAEGRVYRFQQVDNPGPYRPIPQASEPAGLYGDPRANPSLSPAQFEDELEAALADAATIREGLDHLDEPAVRRELLDQIGQPWAEHEGAASWHRSVDDRASATIIEALWAADHRDEALAGVDRLATPPAFDLLLSARAGALLDIAGDPERPTPVRAGALLVLDARNPAALPEAAARYAALLRDPEPRLRRLAASPAFAPSSPGYARWSEAAVAAMRADPDAAVRLNLLQAAASNRQQHPDARDLIAEAQLPASIWPLVAAERHGRALRLRWVTAGEDWSYQGAELRALPEAGEPLAWARPAPSVALSHVSAPLSFGTEYGWLHFEAPLPEASVPFELALHFRGPGDEARTVGAFLRPLGEPAPGPATTVAPIPKAAPAEPEATPPPPGCACRLAAPAREGSRAPVAWLVLIGGALIRRRRRSTASPGACGPASPRADRSQPRWPRARRAG